MARPYTVNISNGSGSTNMLAGDYTVTSNIMGYDNATLTPTSVTVNEEQQTFNFTISGTGTFNIHVTSEGTAEGTAVVGATFIRCDSLGNEYGSTLTTNSTGNISIANVPYSETIGEDVYIYYKQLSSPDDRSFDDTLQSQVLRSSTTTVEIANPLPPLQTFVITDANYANLPVTSGTMTLS